MTATVAKVSAEEFERFALSTEGCGWELHDGELVEKPGTSIGHDWAQGRLVVQLARQLDEDVFAVQSSAFANRGDANYFVPDVCVIPIALVEPDRARWANLNVYAAPLPLVVEVWSPTTAIYDREVKLPEYQRRGDREIWFLHPFERTLSAWRRQDDGSYAESVVQEGTVQPVALPNVTIDLVKLFA